MGDNSCIIQKHLQDKICVTLNKYPTGVSTLLPPVQQHDLSVGLRGDIESPPPPPLPPHLYAAPARTDAEPLQ